MFSESNSTCGSGCQPTRRKRSDDADFARVGWTKSYRNIDIPIDNDGSPHGTGDHEYWFSNSQNFIVYSPDGREAYTDCEKTAIHVRETNRHTPWWTLVNNFTLLFSNSSKYVEAPVHEEFVDSLYTSTIRPNFG